MLHPDIFEPCNGHGWTLVEGKLEPIWFELALFTVDSMNTIEDDSDSDILQESDYMNGGSSDSDQQHYF